MRKTHVWGASSPFDFPPNEYNQGVLRAVEPFLVIHQRPLLDASFDVFRGGMPEAALEACLNYIGPDFADMERSYAEQHTEGNLRHIDTIRLVEKFTKPTVLEYQLLIESLPTSDDENEQSGFVILCGDEGDPELVAGEHGDDLAMDVGTNHESPSDSPTQNEGGRTDCRVQLHDLSPLKRDNLSALTKSQLSPQRCALVAEFKEKEDEHAIFQAAGYSRDEILRNISNKHYKPMYLLVLSKSKFTYGIIKYEGRIRASGNSITDTAYEDFRLSCKDPAVCSPRENLVQRFRDGTKYLRDVYKSGVCYQKRSYIVGDLYLAHQWYALPTTKTDMGMVSRGAKKLYEGLLRIAVGDDVLKWTSMDVENAYTRRTLQSFQQSNIGGINVTRSLLQRMRTTMLCMGAIRVREVQEENDDTPAAKRARHYVG